MSLKFDLEALLDQLADRITSKLVERDPQRRAESSRLVTVEQAALYLGRTKAAVQHLIAEKIIPVVRLDKRIFIDRSDLDRLIEQSKTGGV